MSTLSREDRERISEAIARVEKTTAGEIVVATVRQAHDYVLPRLPLALTSAAILTAATDYAHPVPTAIAVVLQLLLSLLLYTLLGRGVLVRALVDDARLDARVRARAFKLFSELGVHRTSAGSGILIAISELEHRVVILADYGIHARCGDAEWSRHVDAIVRGIRDGNAAAAIVREIEAIGEVLSKEYPLPGENLDELANRVEHRNE